MTLGPGQPHRTHESMPGLLPFLRQNCLSINHTLNVSNVVLLFVRTSSYRHKYRLYLILARHDVVKQAFSMCRHFFEKCSHFLFVHFCVIKVDIGPPIVPNILRCTPPGETAWHRTSSWVLKHISGPGSTLSPFQNLFHGNVLLPRHSPQLQIQGE